jgi:hypothetical protein
MDFPSRKSGLFHLQNAKMQFVGAKHQGVTAVSLSSPFFPTVIEQGSTPVKWPLYLVLPKIC